VTGTFESSTFFLYFSHDSAEFRTFRRDDRVERFPRVTTLSLLQLVELSVLPFLDESPRDKEDAYPVTVIGQAVTPWVTGRYGFSNLPPFCLIVSSFFFFGELRPRM